MNRLIVFHLTHIVLLFFSFEEYPLYFSLFGILINLLSLIKIKHHKKMSFILLPIILGVHFIHYPKFIEAEAMSVFLSLMLYLRYFIYQNKNDLKTNSILSFLNLTALSLFNSSFTFILTLIISIFVFLSFLGFKKKNIPPILILGILFFITIPRIKTNLGSFKMPSKEAIIGYNTSILNTDLVSLKQSTTIILRAHLPKMPQEHLYFRGRSLETTNGYNWYRQIPLNQGPQDLRIILNEKIQDHIYFDDDFIEDDKTPEEKYKEINFRVPKKLQMLVDELSKGKGLSNQIKIFKEYLDREHFLYTLEPGFMPNMHSFLTEKKGFCTHYASLMGIAFRLLGYKTRTVSGFQGGEYNDIGGYYIIKSNDAHAWVEVYYEGIWQRFDPTSYISPNRIALESSDFFEGKTKKDQFLFLTKINAFLDYLNYKTSVFFDDFDSETQKKYLPYTLYLFLLLPFLFIRKRDEKYYLKKLQKKLKQKYKILFTDTMPSSELLKLFPNNGLKDWLNTYHEILFSKKDQASRRKLLKALKDLSFL